MKSSSDGMYSSLASWNDSSDVCWVTVWSSCAWTSCMHCCFLSVKKHIFGKCPTFEQILHLCLLTGHLKLSLCLKSPHCVQSPLDLEFCLPLLSFHIGQLFLLGCDDCCCWLDWLHFWLPFGTSFESLAFSDGKVS